MMLIIWKSKWELFHWKQTIEVACTIIKMTSSTLYAKLIALRWTIHKPLSSNRWRILIWKSGHRSVQRTLCGYYLSERRNLISTLAICIHHGPNNMIINTAFSNQVILLANQKIIKTIINTENYRTSMALDTAVCIVRHNATHSHK